MITFYLAVLSAKLAKFFRSLHYSASNATRVTADKAQTKIGLARQKQKNKAVTLVIQAEEAALHAQNVAHAMKIRADNTANRKSDKLAKLTSI